jgi:tetratricopeptide (TPR) repeat protein
MKPLAIGLSLVSVCLLGLGAWYVTNSYQTGAGQSAEQTRQQSAGEISTRVEATAPPDVDLDDVDQAVVRVVRSAQTDVKINPNSPEAWGKLGMVLLAHEFDDAAAQVFTRAEELQPSEPRWPYLHARAIARSRPADAIPLVERAAKLAGEQELAPQLRLFELYLEVDRASEIEEPLKQFLAKHPTSARAHVVMARLALRSGDLETCLAELKLAENERPAEKSVHELRAEVYQRKGQRAEAEAERRLAAAAPTASWPDTFSAEVGRLQVGLKVLLKRTVKMFAAGRVDESAALAEQIVDQYPDSEWAWILLARAQIAQRRLNQAEISLSKALEINPESLDAQFRMGVIYTLRGLPSQASEYFTDVIAVKPDHPVAHYNLGMCYERSGDPEAAAKHYRKAIEYQPDYFEAHFLLAELLIREEKKDEARPLLERAAELRPADENVKRRLTSLEPAGEENP